MKKLLYLILLLFTLNTQAADAFESGADLYKLCKQAADPAKRSEFSFGLCMGYIDGYISGYLFKNQIKDSPPICNDIEKRSRREVLKNVVDYLEAHPESQRELKSIAMYRAMLDKMTCATADAK
ncbi:MAG: Rap1a/Tai family immunity protein [Methylophilaceae bacterium]